MDCTFVNKPIWMEEREFEFFLTAPNMPANLWHSLTLRWCLKFGGSHTVVYLTYIYFCIHLTVPVSYSSTVLHFHMPGSTIP